MATGHFLALSDVHFDPFKGLSRQDFQALVATSDWKGFFSGRTYPVAESHHDSNYRLLHEVIAQAGGALKQPDFILYPGDFMAHDWWQKYARLAGQDHCQSWTAFTAFTQKAIQLVVDEIAAVFPGSVILPTLGNDDSFCEDYWLQARGAFLSHWAALWKPRLPSGAETASLAELGCYTADLPHMPDHRLIAINNLFWSSGYCGSSHLPGCNTCDSSGWAPGSQHPSTSPGQAVITWLDQALSKAESDQKTVWLLMHIPPGLDSFRANSGFEPTKHRTTWISNQWVSSFLDAFQQTIDQHSVTIQVSFTGHTHMDDFRFGTHSGAPLMHKIIPGVSPIFGNNPAFQVYEYDRQTGVIADWTTHFFDMNGAGWNAKPYGAMDDYGAADPAALQSLFMKMVDGDATVRHSVQAEARAYQSNYFVGRHHIHPTNIPVFGCAALHEGDADFSSCLLDSGAAHVQKVRKLGAATFRHVISELD